MKIYTRTGDKGDTGLLNGKRTRKDSPVFEALGDLDELNSYLGLIKHKIPEEKEFIENLQGSIMEASAHIAENFEGRYPFNGDTLALEKRIDGLQSLVPQQKGLVLPGQTESSGLCHIGRAVCRRGERSLLKLNPPDHLYGFINRLSDYLYILAMYMEFSHMVTEKVRDMLKPQSCDEGISLEQAKALAEAMEKNCRAAGLKAVIALCDKGGNPVLVHVMDGAFLVSYDVAVQKAYTAAALKMPTIKAAELTRPGGEFYGLEALAGGKICTIAGGEPLMAGEKLAGAIGISGGNGEEDGNMARLAVEIWKGGVL